MLAVMGCLCIALRQRLGLEEQQIDIIFFFHLAHSVLQD